MKTEKGLSSVFQAAIDRHLKTEGPKIDLIHKKLQELRELLALRQIDESGFFRKLIDETEPVKTLILISGETFELERTPEGQIKISPQYDGESTYAIGTMVDFDEGGKLRVQGVVHYRGKVTKRKTLPTIYGEVSADEEAREIVNDYLDPKDIPF